ncbi:MAG: septum formation initiator family protein [Oscillospiraceae bacterium]|nr:septum formation initiator family protein [Oscillospiraceae bacterium]
MDRVKRKAKPKRGLPGKLVILIFAVWAAITLVSLQGQINQKKAERDALELELAAQQIQIAMLAKDIESDNMEERIARIARDKLGLVMPEEIIIVNRTP